jgi:hypothetical protein
LSNPAPYGTHEARIEFDSTSTTTVQFQLIQLSIHGQAKVIQFQLIQLSIHGQTQSTCYRLWNMFHLYGEVQCSAS